MRKKYKFEDKTVLQRAQNGDWRRELPQSQATHLVDVWKQIGQIKSSKNLRTCREGFNEVAAAFLAIHDGVKAITKSTSQPLPDFSPLQLAQYLEMLPSNETTDRLLSEARAFSKLYITAQLKFHGLIHTVQEALKISSAVVDRVTDAEEAVANIGQSALEARNVEMAAQEVLRLRSELMELNRAVELRRKQLEDQASLETRITDLTRIAESLGIAIKAATSESNGDDLAASSIGMELVQAAVIPLVDIVDDTKGMLTPGQISLQKAVSKKQSLKRQRNGIFVLIQSIPASYPFRKVPGSARRYKKTGVEVIFSMNPDDKDVKETYSEVPQFSIRLSIVPAAGSKQFEVQCEVCLCPAADNRYIHIPCRHAACENWDLEVMKGTDPLGSSPDITLDNIRRLARAIEEKIYDLAEPLMDFDDDPKVRKLEL